jgi:anti-anti-sigma factor
MCLAFGVVGARGSEGVVPWVDTFLLSRSDVDRRVIVVYGELAFPTADDLSRPLRMLAATVTGEVLLDLSQVTFMDCAGLRVLTCFERLVGLAGGSVRVAAVSPAVALLLELVDPSSRLALSPSPNGGGAVPVPPADA